MRRLPSDAGRADYVAAAVQAGIAATEAELLASDKAVRDLQRLWHYSGDQGCFFAIAMSKSTAYRADNGWVTVVVRDVDDARCDPDAVRELAGQVSGLFRREDVRIVSLLFPLVTEVSALARLVRALGGAGWGIDLDPKPPPGPEWVNVGLRIEVPGTDARAFALGFAPLDHLPPTRRAPFTEIASVAKAKPDWEKPFPMLSTKKHEAHIADLGYYPLPNFSAAAFPTLWERTHDYRLERLGGDDTSAKASVTYLFPKKIWSASG